MGCDNTETDIRDSLEFYLQIKIRDKVLIKALVKNNISTPLTDFKFQCKESYEY